jgi:Domain of unknown function (DUF4118)
MSVHAAGARDSDLTSVITPALPSKQNLTAQTDVRRQLGAPTNSVYQVGVPFSDFVGRCFLRGCLWAELLGSWIQKKQALSDARIESAASWRNHLRMMGWLRSSVGAASCTAVAGCLVPVFSGTTFSPAVPLLFLLVILYVALRFGNIAGIVGTVCAALVFASILFEPRPSLAISSPLERNLLYSMVILGVCASELLGRRKRSVDYKPW